MRELNSQEKQNTDFLGNHGIKHAEICLTETILKKGIFDAIRSVSEILKENGLHDFETQETGSEHKVMIPTQILTFKQVISTSASLYRSKSKGPRRMWITSINKYANANDIYTIVGTPEGLYAINISKISLQACFTSPFDNPIKEFLKHID